MLNRKTVPRPGGSIEDCREFVNLWNERLDDPAAFPASTVARLEEHERICGPCARLAHGFRAMAIRRVAPPVPSGMTDRILAARSESVSRPDRGRFPARAWLGWASGLAAAAVLVLVVLRPMRPGVVPVPERKPIPAVVPSRPWTVALAEATSATLDLAREASAPAARVGQGVIVATRGSDVSWPVAVDPPLPTEDVLESVSRRVRDEVRPLSGSARKAFSFLLGPGSASTSGPSRDSGA